MSCQVGPSGDSGVRVEATAVEGAAFRRSRGKSSSRRPAHRSNASSDIATIKIT